MLLIKSFGLSLDEEAIAQPPETSALANIWLNWSHSAEVSLVRGAYRATFLFIPKQRQKTSFSKREKSRDKVCVCSFKKDIHHIHVACSYWKIYQDKSTLIDTAVEQIIAVRINIKCLKWVTQCNITALIFITVICHHISVMLKSIF